MNNSRIPIHPKRGLDPHLTYCLRCGGETNELTIGHLKLATLRDGRKFFYNYGKKKQALADIGVFESDVIDTRDVEEYEKVPASQPCDACQKEIALHKEEVRKGGVYFRCKECGKSGVIRAEAEFSKMVREEGHIAPPDPIGVEFDKCSQHYKGE